MTQPQNYIPILTNYGLAQEAEAIATGTRLQITQIAIGDGNGDYYTISQSQTALVNEVWRSSINDIIENPQTPNNRIFETLIPIDAGPFDIREIGIFDSSGGLIAVGLLPYREKTLPSSGVSQTIPLSWGVDFSNASIIDFTVDSSIIMATQMDISNHNNDSNAHLGVLHTHSNKTNLDNINQNLNTATSPSFAGLTIGALSGILKAVAGVITGNATKADIGLGNVDNIEQLPLSYLDIDNTLSTNSDARVPSQKAIKAYCDNLLAVNDALIFKGSIDCSSFPNYPAGNAGYVYKVSVAGKIGGASGINVEIGDTLYCTANNSASGTQASVGANWTIVQTNIDGAVVGPTTSSDKAITRFNSTTGKVVQNSQATIDDNGSVNIPLGQSYKINGNPLAKSDVGLGNVQNIDCTNANNITTNVNTAFNQNFETNSSNIQMNGVASAGSSSNISKADHIHPSDTSKVNKSGDTMSGNLAMSGNSVTGLRAAAAPGEAVRYDEFKFPLCVPYSVNIGSVDVNGNANFINSLSSSSVKLLASAVLVSLTHSDGSPDTITSDQTVTGILEGLTSFVKEKGNSIIQAIQTTAANQDLLMDFKTSLIYDYYGNTVNLVGTGSQIGYDIATASFSAGNTATLNKVVAGNLNGVFFSADGTKLYATDKSTSIIYQYTLTTPWIVNTAIYANKSLNTSSQISGGNLYNIFFSVDGTKLYGTHLSSKIVYQYALATPWDISTASYASINYTCSQVTANYFTDIFFSPDGLKMYAVDASTKIVYQYALTSPWNVSTAVYSTFSFTCSQVTANYLYDIFFSPDGTIMYAADGSSNIIYEYNLSTAWGISSAVYTSRSFNTTSQVGSAKLRGIFISSDGSKLYVSDSNTTITYQYSLITNMFSAGTNTGIYVPTITNFGNGPWCVEGRFNLSTITSSTVELISLRNAANWGFILRSVNGVLTLWLSSTNSSWDIASAVTYATALTAGTDYHIRLQFNGSSYVLYLNGTAVITVASSAVVTLATTYMCFGWSKYDVNFYLPSYSRMTDLRITIGKIRNIGAFTPPVAGSLAMDRYLITESAQNPLTMLKPASQNLLMDFKQALTYDYYGNTVNVIGTGVTLANNQFVSGTSSGIQCTTIKTLGAGYWCIEGRFTFNSFGSGVTNPACFSCTVPGTDTGMLVFINSSGKTTLYLGNSGWNIASATVGNITLVTGTQYHISLQFDGNHYILYVNGIPDQIISNSAQISQATTQTAFGYYYGAGANYYLTGTMQDLRITVGLTRYPLYAFTPPSVGSFTAEVQPVFNKLYWLQTSVKPYAAYKLVSGSWILLPYTKLGKCTVANGIMTNVTIYPYNYNWAINREWAINTSFSIGTNGYQVLPSGLIIQWGFYGAIGYFSGATVTFPIAFPNACVFGTVATDGGNGGDGGKQDWASACGFSKASMWIYSNLEGATRNFWWFAIGF